jgi:cation:H+ antiporter
MHELTTYELLIISAGAIVLGIWLLVKGGDWTVDNAIAVASRTGLSKLFIAATIVAFGTSAPELFTSVNANLSGFPGISVGNVIGSNIANVFLVVAVAAMIAPVLFKRSEVLTDTIVMLGATAGMAAAIIAGILPQWGGLIMLAVLVAYVLYQYKTNKLDDEAVEEADVDTKHPVLMLIVGIVTLLIGSEILVQGAVASGIALGVPEAVISVTLVAFGTSLPELTACIAAARKGQNDMIVGGIIGSNIFNILSVMAISAISKPLLIDAHFANFDLIVVMAVTLIFSAFLLFAGKIGRMAGGAMALLYIAFVITQYVVNGSTITVVL